jgi:hypothetical protein
MQALSTSSEIRHSGDSIRRASRQDLLALRWSICVLDLRLAFALIIGDRGVRVRFFAGSSADIEKRMA